MWITKTNMTRYKLESITHFVENLFPFYCLIGYVLAVPILIYMTDTPDILWTTVACVIGFLIGAGLVLGIVGTYIGIYKKKLERIVNIRERRISSTKRKRHGDLHEHTIVIKQEDKDSPYYFACTGCKQNTVDGTLHMPYDKLKRLFLKKHLPEVNGIDIETAINNHIRTAIYTSPILRGS